MAWYDNIGNTLFGDPNSGLKQGANTIQKGYDIALTGLSNDANTAQGMATKGYSRDQQALSQGSTQNRLDMANQFRQDANQYEQDRATQGVMAAYGGDPLSSGTRTAVTGQLAQLARQNYGSALDRANAATNTNMQAGLQSSQNFTNNQLGVQNNLTNQRLATQTGMADSIASNQAAQKGSEGLLGTGLKIANAFF